MYVLKGAEKITQMRELVSEGSWKNYTIEVHALKSTSLSIGAVKLSEFSKKLELAGKSGDYDIIKKENDDLLELFGDVINEGKKLLAEYGIDVEKEEVAETVSSTEEINSENLAEYMAKIRTSCDDFDGDETARLAKEAAAYSYNGKALNVWLDKIAGYAEDFEYDRALEELDKMCAELGLGKE